MLEPQVHFFLHQFEDRKVVTNRKQSEAILKLAIARVVDRGSDGFLSASHDCEDILVSDRGRFYRVTAINGTIVVERIVKFYV